MHRQHDHQAHQTREHIVTSIQQQLSPKQADCYSVDTDNSITFPLLPTVQEQQDDRLSNMSGFFSGSRGTLTNGLEHSRMQLKMYSALMTRESL